MKPKPLTFALLTMAIVGKLTRKLNAPSCPRCASWRVSQTGSRRWRCEACDKRFSLQPEKPDPSAGIDNATTKLKRKYFFKHQGSQDK